MPIRLRRLALALPLLLTLAAIGGARPATTTAATGYAYDTYFWSSYERQVDSRTCVAASTAMMMNILNGRDLNLSQLAILRYAQPRDALNDSVQRGTDPLGWAKAATYFSRYTIRPTTYRWEAYSTESAALRRAATQIARYGKAVGLLVQHGRHAVVMTGFTANRSPLSTSFKVTGIWYSDPLGTRHSYVAASDSPLNTYTQLDATTYYDNAWYGKYIVVVPRG
jgi:peptidase C39-like protein